MCNAALIPAEQYNAVPLGALLIADEHIPFPVKHIHSRKKCIDHLLKHIYHSEMCTSTNETHRSYSKMIMLIPSRLNHLFIFNQLILVRRLSAALPLPGISSPKPILSSKVYLFSHDTNPGSHPKLVENKLVGSPLLQELSIRAEAGFAIEDGFCYCVLAGAASGMLGN